jgi:hypothetical protein
MYLLVLGIVVLNALIALLGDSYQRVQENQVRRRAALRMTRKACWAFARRAGTQRLRTRVHVL